MSARFDRTELAHARAHLEALGYRVDMRCSTWFECRVSSLDEDWVGRGSTADQAFERALASIFPSRAARLALRDLLPPTRRDDDATPCVAFTPEDPTRQIPSVVVAANLAPEPTTREFPLVAPKSCPVSSSELTIVDPIPAEAAKALRELERLREAVLKSEREIALMAPRLQRLHLLVCAARARALRDAAPPSPAVEFAAGIVITLLEKMAQAFWPGTMKHLARSAAPQQCTDDFQASKPPISWAEVAALGQRAIEALSAETDADEHGWCDKDRSQSPADPDRMLQRVAHMCARIERKLADSRAAVDAEVEATLKGCAQSLRWLRPHVRNSVLWGKSIGSIRRVIASHAGLEQIAELIDPAYRPQAPWAAVAGDCISAQRVA